MPLPADIDLSPAVYTGSHMGFSALSDSMCYSRLEGDTGQFKNRRLREENKAAESPLPLDFSICVQYIPIVNENYKAFLPSFGMLGTDLFNAIDGFRQQCHKETRSGETCSLLRHLQDPQLLEKHLCLLNMAKKVLAMATAMALNPSTRVETTEYGTPPRPALNYERTPVTRCVPTRQQSITILTPSPSSTQSRAVTPHDVKHSYPVIIPVTWSAFAATTTPNFESCIQTAILDMLVKIIAVSFRRRNGRGH
ncbi:hypothetical protein SODALDRAFT_363245 [Sodiomyces alkalinus F11]|uniref:Uncharacterized protein n=1 Tax=Sodiomyces alkalinus (strain CBS 110278 / VKM F-3762 / F11) TaxID=1314773 RepID=A0A3N2PLL5_SODAK|nr:hypothetical protein SODALDRAFT_363245 [Sodiomyces alkalinus F11]ROT35417.1 hypothetical protein SODALDRAFT_363245 [Sodiomyces alkalinus F11]